MFSPASRRIVQIQHHLFSGRARNSFASGMYSFIRSRSERLIFLSGFRFLIAPFRFHETRVPSFFSFRMNPSRRLILRFRNRLDRCRLSGARSGLKFATPAGSARAICEAIARVCYTSDFPTTENFAESVGASRESFAATYQILYEWSFRMLHSVLAAKRHPPFRLGWIRSFCRKFAHLPMSVRIFAA